MKNIIVTISVSGIVFILILAAALIFQKMNMADSIKNADNALNKEINTIESSLLKNGQTPEAPAPTGDNATPPTPAPIEQAAPAPTAEQPTPAPIGDNATLPAPAPTM